jgi:hypothetical protein
LGHEQNNIFGFLAAECHNRVSNCRTASINAIDGGFWCVVFPDLLQEVIISRPKGAPTTKLNLLYGRFFCFIFETCYLASMKKGSKLTDSKYSLVIRHLSREPVFSSNSPSLREIVRLVGDFIPGMDTYSKVYREIRENLGVYMGLFVLPVPKKKVRHVVVTITCDTVSDEDYNRWYARASHLPIGELPADF